MMQKRSDMYIQRIMKQAPVVVAPEKSVAEARSLLLRNGVRHLPVVDEQGVLVGILSVRDLEALEATSPREGVDVGALSWQAPVSGVMARSPVITAPEAEPEEVLDLMLEYGIGALPVVSCRGQLVGLVSYEDLVSTAAMLRLQDGPAHAP
jgi:acetoin utilization protein AcuB